MSKPVGNHVRQSRQHPYIAKHPSPKGKRFPASKDQGNNGPALRKPLHPVTSGTQQSHSGQHGSGKTHHAGMNTRPAAHKHKAKKHPHKKAVFNLPAQPRQAPPPLLRHGWTSVHGAQVGGLEKIIANSNDPVQSRHIARLINASNDPSFDKIVIAIKGR